MKKKTNTPTVPINTLSIQRRIYPDLLNMITDIANNTPGTTATKVAAGLLCKQLCLPDPVRKNVAKDKEA